MLQQPSVARFRQPGTTALSSSLLGKTRRACARRLGEKAQAEKSASSLESRRHDLTQDHIEPRRPSGAGWALAGKPTPARETWVNAAAGLLAVTEVTREPLPAYRLTLTLTEGGRCSAAEVLLALFDFGLFEAQESDFARPGALRIFLCPVGE